MQTSGTNETFWIFYKLRSNTHESDPCGSFSKVLFSAELAGSAGCLVTQLTDCDGNADCWAGTEQLDALATVTWLGTEAADGLTVAVSVVVTCVSATVAVFSNWPADTYTHRLSQHTNSPLDTATENNFNIPLDTAIEDIKLYTVGLICVAPGVSLWAHTRYTVYMSTNSLWLLPLGFTRNHNVIQKTKNSTTHHTTTSEESGHSDMQHTHKILWSTSTKWPILCPVER